MRTTPLRVPMPFGRYGELFTPAAMRAISAAANLRERDGADYAAAAEHAERAADFLLLRVQVENADPPGERARWLGKVGQGAAELLGLLDNPEASWGLREPAGALLDAGLPLVPEPQLSQLVCLLREIGCRAYVLATAASGLQTGKKRPGLAIPEFLMHVQPAYVELTGRAFGRPTIREDGPPVRFLHQVADHIASTVDCAGSDLHQELERLRKPGALDRHLRALTKSLPKK